MSAIEKLIERLPYGDGAIRRRFYLGLIFVSLSLAHYYFAKGGPAFGITNLSQLVGFEPRDLLNSTQVLVVAAIIVLILGSILDAMIDVFVLRGVSMTLALINRSIGFAHSWNSVLRGLWHFLIVLVSIPFWPLAIIGCSVFYTATLRGRVNRIELAANDVLSKDAAHFYQARLSTSTQTGLDEVYGDLSGVAWQRLMDFVPEVHRPWVGRLNVRNRDVASFIASAILALVTSMVVNYVSFCESALMLVTTYSALCLLSYLFFGCAAIVRRSTVAVLELAAATHK